MNIDSSFFFLDDPEEDVVSIVIKATLLASGCFLHVPFFTQRLCEEERRSNLIMI